MVASAPSRPAEWSSNYHGAVDRIENYSQDIAASSSLFQCHINGPDEKHTNSAAKLVFWDRKGTENFLNQCVGGKFQVGSYTANVRMNRILTGEQPQSDNSRIVGPEEIVNEDYLRAFFETKDFYYQLEGVSVMVHNHTTHIKRLEYRFASYQAQAATADRILQRAILGKTQIFLRFLDAIEHFGIRIVYRPGKANVLADYLSRPTEMANPATELTEQPVVQDFRLLTRLDLQAIFEHINQGQTLPPALKEMRRHFVSHDNQLYKICRHERAPGDAPHAGGTATRATTLQKVVEYDELLIELRRLHHDQGHATVGTIQRDALKEFWHPELQLAIQQVVSECPSCQLMRKPSIFEQSNSSLESFDTLMVPLLIGNTSLCSLRASHAIPDSVGCLDVTKHQRT
ncbi:hypothetical protein GGR54DRAFT_647414 [Hypoxylon sp. NC1633]|nr:hypothetical protein GGR54DRAFT_647414 [Hypoxylon sp. NC1633]